MSRASGRFAMAVHALALIASAEDRLDSAFIAWSIGTTPAHARQILAELARAGLVDAKQGRDGGYRLARSAAAITLAEVLRVVEDEQVLPASACEPSSVCFIAAGMAQTFDELRARTQDAVLATLGRETVADVARRAQQVSGRPTPEGFRKL